MSGKNNLKFLSGGGEMGERTRNFDWSKSTLGTTGQWHMSLKNSVSNMLRTGFPMLVLWGKDHICFYNDAFRPSLGEEQHPALGNKAQDIWPEGWDFIGTQLKKVVTTGEPVTFENQPVLIVRNGRAEDVYWTFCYSLILDDNGDPGGVLVTCMETTARQERTYETVISATPDLVYVFDLEYRFSYANKALLTMWGKTWETAIGKGLRDNGYEEWHAAMHEREIDHVVATGESVRGEVSFPHAVLGRRVYDYILVPVFNRSGRVEAVAGTTRDISDIKQIEEQLRNSEEQFRNLVLQAPVAIAVFRGENFIADIVNKEYLKLIDKTDPEFLNVPLFESLPLVRPAVEPILRNLMQTGEPYYGNELEVVLHRHGADHTCYFNFVYSPLFGKSGTVDGFIAVANEVTTQVIARRKIEELQLGLERQVQVRTEELLATNEELAATNEELSESTQLLLRSNEELSQFAYVASHDLQEPVRKISVFVEMLERSLPDIDERAKKYLEKINDSAHRMLTLIRDVLKHSQISNSIAKFEKVPLGKVLSNTLSEFEVLIQERGCKIESDELPVIDAIESQMGQLFSNLISNAMKFASNTKPLVLQIRAAKLSKGEKVSYAPLADNKEYYRISFIDNGIGFEQSYAVQIFDIFQRLHARNEYSGTGIGLATCKKIVQNHGGLIYAISSLGNGATFELILPAVQG